MGGGHGVEHLAGGEGGAGVGVERKARKERGGRVRGGV